MNESSIEVPGLRILHEIGRGAQSIVYRAQRGSETYAVKVQRRTEDGLDSPATRRFRKEAATLARLRSCGLPSVLALGETRNRIYAVMEYVSGQTLAALMASGALAEHRVAAIAQGIAEALEEIHRTGLVHRDVKPTNILVDTRDRPKLIDLGFVTETVEGSPSGPVAGTFEYCAPEQTGMLKLPLDGRADLYSLGVVMFRALTGKLPFQYQDPAKLIRQHAIQAPPDPRRLNPQLSPVMAQMVLKLLAKDPDDRYGTARSLVHDLRSLQSLNHRMAAGENVTLGAGGPAFAGARVVARQDEENRLELSWHQATRGAGCLVQVEGEAGIGKSALVDSVFERLAAAGAVILRASCSAVASAPMAPLIDAVNRFIGELRCDPKQVDSVAYGKLRRSIAGTAPLLRRFSPALVDLVGGDVVEVRDLDIQDEQYYSAVADLVANIAQSYGGAVLYIDDGQWLDDASWRVLRQLVRRLPEIPLLLVVTQENRSPSQEAPWLSNGNLALTEADLSAHPSTEVLRLSLPPLDKAGVAELVRSYLGTEKVDAAVVSELHDRTHGNPLAVLEYLNAMCDAGLLYPFWGAWAVRPGAMQTLELPASVTDLITARLKELEPASLEVLGACALLGLRFDVSELAAICSPTKSKVLAALSEARSLRLIEVDEDGHYTFVHPQVREEARRQLSGERQRQLHQRAAQALAKHRQMSPETAYEVARHFCRGLPAEDPQEAFEALVRAANFASESYAHEQALHYFDEASQLAAEFGIEPDARFYCAKGEVSSRLGKIEEATLAAERGLELAQDPLLRARLSVLETNIYLSSGNVGHAQETIDAAFAALGVKVPRSRAQLVLSCLAQWLKAKAQERLPRLFRSRWSKQAQQTLHETTFLATCVGLFKEDHLYTLHSHLRTHNAALDLGPSRELVVAYASYAYLLSDLGFWRWSARHMEKAQRMALKIKDPVAAGFLLSVESIIKVIQGDLLGGEEAARRCIEDYANWIPRVQFVHTISMLFWNHLMRGRIALGWEWMKRGGARAGVDLSGDSFHLGNPWIHTAASLFLLRLGRYSEAKDQHDRAGQVAELPQTSGLHRRVTDTYRALYLVESGELGVGLDDLIARIKKQRQNNTTVQFYLRMILIVRMYAEIARAIRNRESGEEVDLRPLRRLCRRMQRTRLEPIFAAHAQVGVSALAWLSGNFDEARQGMSRAEWTAERLDAPWVCIEIARLRAYMAGDQGRREVAAAHTRFAWQLAVDTGWKHLAVSLSRELQEAGALSGSKSEAGSTAARIDATLSRRKLDALLQVSLASVSVLDFDDLARSALDTVIRVVAAERGMLFLVQGAAGELAFHVGQGDGGGELTQVDAYSSTVVNRVHAAREPMIVSSSSEGVLLGSESVVAHDIRSIVAVPLELRDRLIGVLYLDSRLSRGIFTLEDLDLLRGIGSQLAIVLENARAAQLAVQVEAEKQKHTLTERIRQMTQALLSASEPADIVRLALAGIEDTLKPAAALGVVVEPRRRSCRLVDRHGVLRDPTGSANLPDAQEVPAKLHALVAAADGIVRGLRVAGAVCRGRLNLAGEWCHGGEAKPGSGLAQGPSVLAVPLWVNKRLAAALILAGSKDQALLESAEDVAQTFSGPAAIAMERASLFHEVERMATTDELTGLRNRRQLFEVGERELKRCRRHGYPLCAIMIDVDHFKKVNDEYGHSAGDEVLTHLGCVLATSVRDVDVTSRYGGEEFTLLMPHTELEDALVVAEGLRTKLASKPVQTEAGDIPITISLGVAKYQGRESLTQLLAKADEALYATKQAGRNRVMVATEHPVAVG